LGDRKGIRPVKKLDVGLLVVMNLTVRLIAPVVQLSPPPPSSFASINTPANPGSSGNGQRERERERSNIRQNRPQVTIDN